MSYNKQLGKIKERILIARALKGSILALAVFILTSLIWNPTGCLASIFHH